MIVTSSKPYKEIKSKLKKSDKIGIVSCNSCARMCHTGGELKMKEFSDNLKKEGFNVIDMDLIGTACNFDQLKKNELKGDVTIVLACDSAVYNLKKLFKKRRIVPALNTLGIGAFDSKGKINLVKRFK
jgi:hypothetical protein